MPRIRRGTVVTWTSQGAGGYKAKTGTVLAFIPGNDSLCSIYPAIKDVPKGRRRFDYDDSLPDRYLVEVPRQGAKGPLPSWYYAPIASVVEEANAHA